MFLFEEGEKLELLAIIFTFVLLTAENGHGDLKFIMHVMISVIESRRLIRMFHLGSLSGI